MLIEAASPAVAILAAAGTCALVAALASMADRGPARVGVAPPEEGC